MAKSPEDALVSMIANMPEKTGKSLEAWLLIAAEAQAEKHGQIVAFLKQQHGLGHGYANLVALRYLESKTQPVAKDDLVEVQYADKPSLVPIYEALCKAIGAFGADVEFSPKKANVSVRRNKQFALIQPSTKTRLDLGIQLKGEPAGPRLEASGSFNAMVSHRVRLESPDQVDAELLAWLRLAYDRA